MKIAIAFATRMIMNSRIKPWLDWKCQTRGISIDWSCVTDSTSEYRALYVANDNIISWNCKQPHEWMSYGEKNVLYLDNSLISQSAGVFVDNGGLFSKSNLCRGVDESHDYKHLNFVSKRDFGWKAFSGGNPNGPILVALQWRLDSNINMEFPLAASEPDKVVATLKLLKLFLPPDKRGIIIRPHPREKEKFDNGGIWRDDWTFSMEGSFKDILPKCSALVTVNSTCASEALLLGMPVATLGTGAFSGSGATLECNSDPFKIAKIASFKPDLAKCRAYCSAVMANHFLPYDVTGDRKCPELEKWLDRATCH